MVLTPVLSLQCSSIARKAGLSSHNVWYTRIYDRSEKTLNTALNYIINQNTFVEGRFTHVNTGYDIIFQPEAEALPYIDDYAEPYGSLTNARYNEIYGRTRYQAGITGTHFVDNALGGNHEIKLGADWEVSSFLWTAWRKDVTQLYYNNGPYLLLEHPRYLQLNIKFIDINES